MAPNSAEVQSETTEKVTDARIEKVQRMSSPAQRLESIVIDVICKTGKHVET